MSEKSGVKIIRAKGPITIKGFLNACSFHSTVLCNEIFSVNGVEMHKPCGLDAVMKNAIYSKVEFLKYKGKSNIIKFWFINDRGNPDMVIINGFVD
jgi:hypothetical protein